MKTHLHVSPSPRLIVFLTASLLLASCSLRLASAQGGSLTPPGAPAPTMKSLTEISGEISGVSTQATGIATAVAALRDDSATGIAAAPFTIATPGVYYLKNSISVTTGDAIVISADDVTLDLGGFTIASSASPASGSGILISAVQKNIHIKNGTIRGTTTLSGSTFTTGGFNNGIFSNNTGSRNFVLTGLRLHGIAQTGITFSALGVPGFVVQQCVLSVCGTTGILAHTVRDCDVTGCGDDAIVGTVVTDSAGTSVGTAASDEGIFGTIVTGCRGVATAGHGINATNVTNCAGTSTSRDGINATNIANSHGLSTSGAGISSAGNVTNSTGTTTSGAFGIFASGTLSFCRGKRDGGIALQADIAVACTVDGTGTVSAPQKHLGTP